MRRPDLRKTQGMTGRKKKRSPRKQREFRDLSQPDGDVELVVFEPEEGLRIDRFLGARLPWRSRTQFVDLIADGRVFLNEREVAKPSQRIHERDRVRVEVPRAERIPDAAAIPLAIVYEDPHLIAIDKQPGLVCHPVGKIRHGTLISALHARYRDVESRAADVVPRLCHRLDKDTSGLILVALGEAVRRKMQWIFEARLVAKEYLAIVDGLWERDYDEVRLPLGRAGDAARVHISMAVREDGMPSRTVINVEERFPPAAGDRGFTLLRCSPVTGRQHQIRVHVAARGHPILGDSIYGAAPERGFAFPPGASPEAALLRRHALHAHRLQIPHPIHDSAELDLVAPLPADMAAVLAHLRARRATPY